MGDFGGPFCPCCWRSCSRRLSSPPPAAAQGPEGEPIYITREGPGYELYGDGTLTVGDAVVREARPKGAKPSRDLLRRVEICEEAGFRGPGIESPTQTGGPVLPILVALGLIPSCALCLPCTYRLGPSGGG